MDFSTLNFASILPEIVILGTALLILLTDFVGATISSRESSRSHVLASLSLAGLLIAGVLTAIRIGQPAADFQGMVVDDNYSRYLNLIILLAGVLGVLLSWEYLTRFTTMHSEYYSLFLLAVAGMMFMGKSVELITLFVSLEVLSVSLYVLTGFHRGQLRSAEAALKYFLLGAFASGFLLYGMALLYADTGSTRLADIAATSTGGFFALAGLALLLVGFGFKIGLSPFHMWVPDAYQGAPTPVTAFMSVGTKAAALLAISRVVLHMVSVSYFWWSPALAFLAVLTMTWGNLAALRQSSLKRMLAYSSVAQAGYMLIGLTTGTLNGIQAMLFYLFAYAFMNIGAFAVVALMERIDPEARQDATFDNARGLFTRHPALAVTMAIFMLSLAGIPPLAGFFGKLFLFGAAVQSGWVLLAVAGVLNSVVSAFYYLRVTVVMFMDEPSAETRVLLPIPKSAVVGLTLALLGTVLFGLLASPWFATLSQMVVAQAGG
jgi:NADH-quinone oxidoreductase subunit N